MGNKLLFYLFCLGLLCSKSYSQDTIHKGWYIGLMVSPESAFRSLTATGDDYMAFQDIQRRNMYEIPKYSFSAGIEILHDFSKRMSISFGARYTIRGEATKPIPATFYNGYDTSGVSVRSNYKPVYLDLPVSFHFYIIHSKISPYLIAGLIPSFFMLENISDDVIARDGSETHYSGKDTYDKTFRKVSVLGSFGFGVDYSFRKSRVRIEPVYTISLTASKNDGFISDHYYSYALNIYYFFKL